MEAYLMSLGVDVWNSVLVEYVVPLTPLIDLDRRKNYVNNAKAKNVILFDLNQLELMNVMHCHSTKWVWEKLKNG